MRARTAGASFATTTHEAARQLIEIVVYEHARVLKCKFFVDTLQAADFVVTEFNIATERVVQ